MSTTRSSPELQRRLAAQPPDSPVQEVLMLAVALRSLGGPRRDAGLARRKAVDAVRADADRALPEIDRVLARFGGRRLADRADALGGLPVETTPAGLRALADSVQVKAIPEDQPLSLVR